MLIAKAVRKTGFDTYKLQRIDFLYAKEFSRPQKAAKILQGACKEAGLEFMHLIDLIKGQDVLEIGCGQHAGLMPLAMVAGAQTYIGVDPLFNEQLIADSNTGGRYLATALSANALFLEAESYNLRSPNLTPDTALEKSRFVRGGIAQIQTTYPQFDIAISISCLEHITDFSKAACEIVTASKTARHFHIVNFSNHLHKERPFDDLYEKPMPDFSQKWNGSINGLRVFEMVKAFEEAGLSLKAYPLDVVPQALPDRVDPWWVARYSREELSIRTAILTNIDFPSPGGFQ